MSGIYAREQKIPIAGVRGEIPFEYNLLTPLKRQ
jgi:hypothetical protein